MNNTEKTTLVQQIKACIKELKELGVNDEEIYELFQPAIELSRIEIDEKYKIRFVDYDNGLELQLSPIHKAVYCLFLAHPEGIKYKYLTDYRDELRNIYIGLKKNTQVKEKVERTLSDITNPLNPSIIQKCSRINGAIIKLLGKHKARPYLITGKKGESRGVAISPDLIIKKRPPMNDGR